MTWDNVGQKSEDILDMEYLNEKPEDDVFNLSLGEKLNPKLYTYQTFSNHYGTENPTLGSNSFTSGVSDITVELTEGWGNDESDQNDATHV